MASDFIGIRVQLSSKRLLEEHKPSSFGVRSVAAAVRARSSLISHR